MADRSLGRSLSGPLGTRPRAIRAALADRFAGLRDRLVQDPRFQRWAARFPLTRFIARRKSAALFDLCAGFVYSQILAACNTLGIFDLLRSGPGPVPALADQLGLPADRLRALLRAAVALDLLEERAGDRIGLGTLGAALLGNPGVRDMIAHHRSLYADLADPVALLAGDGGGRLSRFWPYAEAALPGAISQDEAGPYTELMAASQALIAGDVLAAWRFARHRHVLDLGGGSGRFAESVARVAPDTRITLFDLPAVAALAELRLDEAGMTGRIAVRGGDFFHDPLPAGADLVTLIRILHDHDDDRALALLGRIRGILPRGGQVLIAEPMAGGSREERAASAYFGLYLLAMGSGRPRSSAEYRELLAKSGFRPFEVGTARPLLVRIMAGEAVG